ncbi:MAG: hypothetical protein N3D17_05840 [bacterium]|nr:hypothetical protein [bacterium]
MSRYTEITGCIHIHYPLRKLEKKIELLGKVGEEAGLNFLIINSHTPEKNSKKYENIFKKEGYYGKTLVITAEETDDKRRQNHLLIIGGDRWYGKRKTAEDVLCDIKPYNIISFVAHPDGYHRLFIIKKQHLWENWDLDGFTGIEVWSMLFDWARDTRVYNLPLRYLGFPHNLKGPSKNILSVWDELYIKKKVVGIAGLDIHNLPFFFRMLDIKKCFQYSSIFKCLRNHILLKEPLTGNPEKDKKNIIGSIKSGSLFFANDLIFNSSGFFFGTEDGENIMGDAVPFGTTLFIKNPLKTKTRIICNGRIIFEEEIEYKKFRTEIKGIYRIEVERYGKPWIFSNPVSVEIL